MLSYQSVFPDTLELLKGMMSLPSLRETRLVGGTALALQYGHRRSVDLDFFGRLEEDCTPLRRELSALGSMVVFKETPTIRIYSINGVKVDVVDYREYPWIDDAVCEDGIRLASPKDIAAMKVHAIHNRGSRKDFVDMYFLLQHFTLEEVIGLFSEKYSDHNTFRTLLSLTYFEDAEAEQMPDMLKEAGWDDMKRLIRQEVIRIQ